MSNIIPLRRRRPVGAPNEYDPHGWLEIPDHIYDWFQRNPFLCTYVHEYGFLHHTTGRAFVCIPLHDGTSFICGMSNSPMSIDEFNALRADDVIDAVIDRLGYEPITL